MERFLDDFVCIDFDRFLEEFCRLGEQLSFFLETYDFLKGDFFGEIELFLDNFGLGDLVRLLGEACCLGDFFSFLTGECCFLTGDAFGDLRCRLEEPCSGDSDCILGLTSFVRDRPRRCSDFTCGDLDRRSTFPELLSFNLWLPFLSATLLSVAVFLDRLKNKYIGLEMNLGK